MRSGSTSYSIQEDNRLLSMREQGKSFEAISRVLKRSKKGLIDRYSRLKPQEVKVIVPDDSAACTALAEACDALTARHAAEQSLPFDVAQTWLMGDPQDAGRVMEEVG